VYGHYLRESAAVGLLSVASDSSMEAFEAALRGSDERAREACRSALSGEVPPQALGVLLALDARSSADGDLLASIDASLRSVARRIEFRNMDPRLCVLVADGIRTRIGTIAGDRGALAAALSILARSPREVDRACAREHCAQLDSADIDEIQRLLDGR
jgi:hypothetical protein